MLDRRIIHFGKKYFAVMIAISLVSGSLGFSVPIASAEQTDKDGLLQFTSQNHILGFRSDGVYVASTRHALTTKFLNANNVRPTSEDATETDTSGTIPALSKVTYDNIWDGITAVYEAEKNSLMKSTYYVDITKKGVSANSIRLRYNRPVKINANGDLDIMFDNGLMTEAAPVAWQETSTGRHVVAVSFKLLRKNVVGFKLGEYLPNIPIVIDPSLTWNTFLGGSRADKVYGISVDSSGNVYVGGYSNATWGTPVRAYTSGYDGFVAKLDSSGTLTWNTFLGGSGSDDSVSGIATDTSGNVYAGGWSNATWGSPVRAYTASSYDGFAAKLDSSGTLTWNTFLGGSGEDALYGIAVDTSGNVYGGGYSFTTWGSPVRAYTSGSDGEIVKIDSNGVLVWNTFLGGSGSDDQVKGLVADSSGNVYAGGWTNATWGSPVRAYTSGYDGFVAKLDTGGALTWHTFLGGSGSDDGIDAKPAVDSSGNVYVGGFSDATWGSPVRAYTASSYDGFAAKLNSSGTLTWHTFLGGSGEDALYGISVDTSGNVYSAGYSFTTWGSPIRAYGSGSDGEVVRLDSNGVLVWNTFLGGAGNNEKTYPMTVDTSGNLYIGGYSDATWGSPVRPYTSSTDGLVVKMLDDTTSPTAAITYSSSGPYASGNAVTITATFSEAIVDSPVPQISISGSQTLAATNMTKVSTTVYTYDLTVGASNGTATVAMSTGTDASSNVVTSAPTSGATFTIDNTVATVAVEESADTTVVRHGGGRGSKAPGRGGTAPMIDLKTMQIISTTDSSRAVPSAHSQQQPSNSTQQSSPAVLLVQNQRDKLLARIEKKIEAAISSAAKTSLESNRDRLLKRIDARIESLLSTGR